MTQQLCLEPVHEALYSRVQAFLAGKAKLLGETVQIVSTPGTKPFLFELELMRDPHLLSFWPRNSARQVQFCNLRLIKLRQGQNCRKHMYSISKAIHLGILYVFLTYRGTWTNL